jgi:cytochrome bd ubiquinol oxidase subunit II
MVAIDGASLWTALANPSVALRWFGWPDIAILAPVPVITALMACLTGRALRGQSRDAAAS